MNDLDSLGVRWYEPKLRSRRHREATSAGATDREIPLQVELSARSLTDNELAGSGVDRERRCPRRTSGRSDRRRITIGNGYRDAGVDRAGIARARNAGAAPCG